MAIYSIVDLPIKNGKIVIFHTYVSLWGISICLYFTDCLMNRYVENHNIMVNAKSPKAVCPVPALHSLSRKHYPWHLTVSWALTRWDAMGFLRQGPICHANDPTDWFAVLSCLFQDRFKASSWGSSFWPRSSWAQRDWVDCLRAVAVASAPCVRCHKSALLGRCWVVSVLKQCFFLL